MKLPKHSAFVLVMSLLLPLTCGSAMAHDLSRVAFSGDANPLGSAGATFGTNLQPLGLTDNGTTMFYPETFFGGTSAIYESFSNGSLGGLINGTPSPQGGTFYSYPNANIALTGAIAFIGETQGSTGIYLRSGSTITALAMEKGAAAGDGTFKSGAFGSDAPQVNNRSEVAFIASTTGSGQGVFLATGGSLQIIAKIGSNSQDGGVFTSFIGGTCAVNAPAGQDAQVAFIAHTTGSAGTGLFLGSRTKMNLIKSIPDGNYSYWMNNAGQIVYLNNNTIVLATASGSVNAVTNGDPAPGGGTINWISDPMINDQGWIVFYGAVGENFSVFLRRAANDMIIVAADGQAIDGGTLIVGPPEINNAGMVMFSGEVLRSSNSTDAIFLWANGELQSLVALGDSFGGSTLVLTRGISDTGPTPAARGTMPGGGSFNSSGQVACSTSLGNGAMGILVASPTVHWRATGGGAWGTAANWTFGMVPSAGTSTYVDPAFDATISGPAADARVKSLVVGDGTHAVTFNLTNNATFTIPSGLTLAANSQLNGSGTINGPLFVSGTHTHDSGLPGQVINGPATYHGSSVFVCDFLHGATPGSPMSCGALTVEGGARVDFAIPGPDVVNFAAPFWQDVHTWTLINASGVSGGFDAGYFIGNGNDVDTCLGIGDFYINNNATTIEVQWRPRESKPVVATLASQIDGLGMPLTLTASATGGALTYQWQKDRLAIKGATSNPYRVAAAALTTAGTYAVTATNAVPPSATSNQANVGVINMAASLTTVNVGGTLKLTLSAAGPGLTYQWSKDGTPLSDAKAGARSLAGSGTSTLAITQMGDMDAGAYTCRVTMPDPANAASPVTATSGAFTVTIRHKPVVNAAANPFAWMVSSTVTDQITVLNHDATAYTITGLPAGVTYNRTTGQLGGKPVAVKTGGRFTVIAANPAGSSVAQVFTYNVTALTSNIAGTYEGLIPASSLSNGLGSRVSLTIAGTGVMTFKITTGGTTLGLVKALDASPGADPSAVLSLPRTGATPLALTFTPHSSSSITTATLTDGGATTVTFSLWRNVWSTAHKATAYKAYYTFGIENGNADRSLPQGFGFGAFTVNEVTGGLTISGRLADSSVLSCAAFLSEDGHVMLYQPLYGNRGSCLGVLTLTQGATAPAQNTVGGTLAWMKPSPLPTSTDTVYKAGFGPLNVTVAGSPYAAPAKGQRVLGLPASQGTNASLAFTLGGLDAEGKEFSQALRIANPSATGVTNSASVTPYNAKLSPNPNPYHTVVTTFNAATGIYGGTFLIPGATTALNRTAGFLGQIVTTPTGTAGCGYFLLPELPVAKQTVATSPKLSGRAELTGP